MEEKWKQCLNWSRHSPFETFFLSKRTRGFRVTLRQVELQESTGSAPVFTDHGSLSYMVEVVKHNWSSTFTQDFVANINSVGHVWWITKSGDWASQSDCSQYFSGHTHTCRTERFFLYIEWNVSAREHPCYFLWLRLSWDVKSNWLNDQYICINKSAAKIVM